MNSALPLDMFVEDRAHEHFIRALVARLAAEEKKDVDIRVRSATGGHGKAISEFKMYQALLDKKGLSAPALIVVAIDANCSKPTAKRKEILDIVPPARRAAVVVACPDPHVERWYMADIASFGRIVGASPRIKQKKCVRDYYKTALANAITRAGHPLTLGGLEFAEELAQGMNLYDSGKVDRAFASFIQDLRSALRRL
ncbi:MAG: hypothetical protein FJ118_16030 [Deltaproteobacteria bacterium]|nr:hypothetical protein [Deltaproteobacteria bacterium]